MPHGTESQRNEISLPQAVLLAQFGSQVFPLGLSVWSFPLVMPSSTSVASSARPQVQGATERKAPVLRFMALQSFYPGNLFSYLYLYLPMPPLLPIFARLPAWQQLAAWNQNTGTKGFTKEKKTWTHHTHPLKSSVRLRYGEFMRGQ